MTTPYGLRIVWEFLDNAFVLDKYHLFITSLPSWMAVEKSLMLPRTISSR